MASSGVAAAAFLAALTGYGLDSQETVPAAALTYADSADLALPAPIAVHVRVVRARRLGLEQSVNLAPGRRRFLVEAEVVALIRGPTSLPSRVSYLVDLADAAPGRPAAIARRSEFILLASPAAERPNELRLIAADAQLAYSAATAEQIRAILREAGAPDAPPAVTALGRAFHVPGAIPGESETQIFLQTANQRPVSLSVLRRPGEEPRWAVSLSELVDESAVAPRPDTLLWYRLACTLPRALPAQSLASAPAGEAAAIRADYQLVMASLGPCRRNRRR